MTTKPREGAQDRRRGSQDPAVVGLGVDSAQGNSAPPAYCEGGCGHDLAHHRGGRCWVDAMGNPIYRSRSLIACLCDGVTRGAQR